MTNEPTTSTHVVRLSHRVSTWLRDLAVERIPTVAPRAHEWWTCVETFGVDTHPARGALLGLIKAASGLPIQVNPPLTDKERWLVYAITDHGEFQQHELVGRGPTELDALVDALETF